VRNFGFLKKKNEKLFKSLLRLPYVPEQKKFDSDFQALIDYFEPLKEMYKNSYNYLKDRYEFKEKWANSYKPIFLLLERRLHQDRSL